MNKETLRRLELLNQLELTEEEKVSVSDFFAARNEDLASLAAVETENVERMVHVMPLSTVVREDVAHQPFTREDLQAGAPEAEDGYWLVPRVVE